MVVLHGMRGSSTFSKSNQRSPRAARLARTLAPEDVRTGDYVALLHQTCELPSFLWCAESFQIAHDQPVRIQLLPELAGIPLKVCAVCLPFVFVKHANGTHQTLDVRGCRLARLHRSYAKVVWKAEKKRATQSPLSLL